MVDAVTARLQDALTIVVRTTLDLPDGEVRQQVQLARAALTDAVEAHNEERRRHERALADALRMAEEAA